VLRVVVVAAGYGCYPPTSVANFNALRYVQLNHLLTVKFEFLDSNSDTVNKSTHSDETLRINSLSRPAMPT
jgi:hypothetical protein